MDKIENIDEILHQIQLSEGEEFECDRDALKAEYLKESSGKSSLAIKVLSIFGVLFGTILFIIFMFAAGLYNSDTGLLVFGVGFIGGAITLNFAYDKLIIDTISLSLFSMGFTMIGMGLSELGMEANTIQFVFILIALATLFITQNYLISFISVLAISGNVLALIANNKWAYEMIHVYTVVVALILAFTIFKEARIITTSKKLSKLYNPVRIALIFSFIAGLFFIGKKGLISISPNYLWVSSVVSICAIFYVIYILCNTFNVQRQQDKIMVYGTAFVLLAPTAFAPAISGAMLIILLSFLVNYKTGLVVGVIAFIYFVLQYYYDLNFTLLTKSIILFFSGVIFILFYIFTTKKLTAHE